MSEQNEEKISRSAQAYAIAAQCVGQNHIGHKAMVKQAEAKGAEVFHVLMAMSALMTRQELDKTTSMMHLHGAIARSSIKGFSASMKCMGHEEIEYNAILCIRHDILTFAYSRCMIENGGPKQGHKALVAAMKASIDELTASVIDHGGFAAAIINKKGAY